ncbi:hypothetical protein Nepgr_024226 [Nepenthes gracilis]|uniref:Uncharacterized protein n=1 Tax=Nepenthes gracilis TaxID=150966 RepID=A0AAD3T2D6_NEPGR|nr:hypothetical protein Nepgr_024226 [Nepenthes gracilis]
MVFCVGGQGFSALISIDGIGDSVPSDSSEGQPFQVLRSSESATSLTDLFVVRWPISGSGALHRAIIGCTASSTC